VFSSPSPAPGPTGRPAQRLGAARSAKAHRAGGFRRRALQRLMLAGATVLAVIVVLFAASAIYVLTLPGVGNAEQRVQRILARHHGTYNGPAPPAKLGDAVVAVEDEHFYSNFLINILEGAGRAALAAVKTSRDPGGSTIAQQLAQQLYGHGSGLSATLREIGLGVKLSLAYPKPQILDLYLNAVYYGHGYWGDQAAARGYFGAGPNGLDWAQAAMLAGLLQAPSALDPLEHYALAKHRQRHVLDQLVANHYLTGSQADAAYLEPLELK
jgi:membrane peptidoglycan carboxypeptidase